MTRTLKQISIDLKEVSSEKEKKRLSREAGQIWGNINFHIAELKSSGMLDIQEFNQGFKSAQDKNNNKGDVGK